ncbi:hypothetical protein, partial [Bacillus licheniformis]|uniref:hypothetical protein n=1 Tax=Bacillus licheniformis TaxID=1402 RepID=UPI001C930FC8
PFRKKPAALTNSIHTATFPPSKNRTIPFKSTPLHSPSINSPKKFSTFYTKTLKNKKSPQITYSLHLFTSQTQPFITTY